MQGMMQLKPPKPYTISQEALDAALAEPLPVEPRRPPQADKNGFRQVMGATGKTLHILEKRANHPESMKLLSEAGLRPMTYQELLLLLMEDEQLKNALKGKHFWLAGQGIEKEGVFTINEKGELREIAREERLSAERKVNVCKGNRPLSFGVYSDYVAPGIGWRFFLYADYEPQIAAPVVVGVPVAQRPQ